MIQNHRPPSLSRPLSSKEVLASRNQYGSNTLSHKKKKGFLRSFFENLGDPVIRILLGALVIDLIFSLTGDGGNWVETGGIALAVFLATLISTLSEYGSEAAFARLSDACAQATCRARRLADENASSATVQEISLAEAVVGDVLLLSAGEMIP